MRKSSSTALLKLFLLIYCLDVVQQCHGDSASEELDPDTDLDSDYSDDYILDDVTPTRLESGCEDGMFQCADK